MRHSQKAPVLNLMWLHYTCHFPKIGEQTLTSNIQQKAILYFHNHRFSVGSKIQLISLDMSQAPQRAANAAAK
jgi:hypothetical protein